MYKIALFLIFILLNILDNAYSQESWVINDEVNSLFIEAYNEALFQTNEDASEDDIILEDNFVVDINDNIFDITASGEDGAKIMNQELLKKLFDELINKLLKENMIGII